MQQTERKIVKIVSKKPLKPLIAELASNLLIKNMSEIPRSLLRSA